MVTTTPRFRPPNRRTNLGNPAAVSSISTSDASFFARCLGITMPSSTTSATPLQGGSMVQDFHTGLGALLPAQGGSRRRVRDVPAQTATMVHTCEMSSPMQCDLRRTRTIRSTHLMNWPPGTLGRAPPGGEMLSELSTEFCRWKGCPSWHAPRTLHSLLVPPVRRPGRSKPPLPNPPRPVPSLRNRSKLRDVCRYSSAAPCGCPGFAGLPDGDDPPARSTGPARLRACTHLGQQPHAAAYSSTGTDTSIVEAAARRPRLSLPRVLGSYTGSQS